MSGEEGIQVWERFGSRSGNATAQRHRFICKGTDEEVEVLEAVKAFAPLVHSDLLRADEPEIEQIGHRLWEAEFAYGIAEEETIGVSGPEFSFETGGATIRIKQALATIASYKRAGDTNPIPDFFGAINIVGDTVEGIDVPAGQFLFAESHSPPLGFVTQSYKVACSRLVGHMNQAPFRSFAPGVVLYLGASGRARGQRWHITHQFAASPNVTIPPSGSLPQVEKLGWDYYDVRYAKWADVASGIMVHEPIYARVLRVLPFGDFSVLGIGA